MENPEHQKLDIVMINNNGEKVESKYLFKHIKDMQNFLNEIDVAVKSIVDKRIAVEGFRN